MNRVSIINITSSVLLISSLCAGHVFAQPGATTDLTGKKFTADELVQALNIPVRGIGTDCSAEREEMSRLTRGIGSATPNTADEVPALNPMRTASVSATFEINSDELTPSAMERLETVAIALKSQELQSQCFQVAGHTCDLGDNAYNMALSRKRAEAVKSFLVAQGIDGKRLVTTGYGETSPLGSNDSENSRQKNRRVDLGALPPR